MATIHVKRSGGAAYLPISVSDLDSWEAQARSDFVRKVFGLVFAQALAACAAAALPMLSPAVRDFVLTHAAMAYIALFAPLILILCARAQRCAFICAS
jgi:FtsH-binding integral membrane protein